MAAPALNNAPAIDDTEDDDIAAPPQATSQSNPDLSQSPPPTAPSLINPRWREVEKQSGDVFLSQTRQQAFDQAFRGDAPLIPLGHRPALFPLTPMQDRNMRAMFWSFYQEAMVNGAKNNGYKNAEPYYHADMVARSLRGTVQVGKQAYIDQLNGDLELSPGGTYWADVMFHHNMVRMRVLGRFGSDGIEVPTFTTIYFWDFTSRKPLISAMFDEGDAGALTRASLAYTATHPDALLSVVEAEAKKVVQAFMGPYD
jgi:hypothetical protein